MGKTIKDTANPGNPDVWAEKYRDYLFRYAVIRLHDADLAEECVQETFLAALQSFKNFQGLSSKKQWLRSILKRKICDHFRRKYRHRQFHSIYSLDQLNPEPHGECIAPVFKSSCWLLDPEKLYEQREFLHTLKQALWELSDRSALVFILREVIGLGSSEICDLMGISISNLHVIMFRVRKRLRGHLRLKWLSEDSNLGEPLTAA